jgi:formate hydrogenlyase transcriptional activator
MRSQNNFGEVVGNSPALREVLQQVEIAAPSDATVLVLGETGTGKELIARAVHRLSSRREGNFIKLNCAAIPSGLLESELFGHEKGAFTGAVSQKIGRLELADKGTLFLDEIGEIAMELQPKLLRVLQDHEFERLGGVKTIRVNIRLIAATNRDLAQAVEERQFRSDLFYRLNVFPIRLPPLRERAGDIPMLVRYFVQKLARRMGKNIDSIPAELLREFEQWHWPGNVRELENFIERSIILTQGSVLFAPVAELRIDLAHAMRKSGSTLEDVEREYILRTLRESGGVIAGLRGAAARLGMKRTTLQSKMQRLGITRDEYET